MPASVSGLPRSVNAVLGASAASEYASATKRRTNALDSNFSRYGITHEIQIAKCGYRINEPFEDVIPDETPTELDKRLKTLT